MKVRNAAFTLSALVMGVINTLGANPEDNDPKWDGVVGTYERQPSENDWHYAKIDSAPNTDKGYKRYSWSNKAGKGWTVGRGLTTTNPTTYWLQFEKDAPYPGHRLVIKRDAKGEIIKLIEYVDGDKEYANPVNTWVKKPTAQRPEPEKKPTIRSGNLGEGTVFGVNKPGDGSFKALKPDFGDKVNLTTYTPINDSNKDLGLVSGESYSMLMVTGKDKQQAFVYWNTPDPRFQDILQGKSSKIASIGNRGFTLERGDELTIQAQKNSEGAGTDITFTFYRGNKSTGTISFIVN